VVDSDGLGDLEETDQFESVETLGAGLVAVHLRQARVDGGVGGDEAVDVAQPKLRPRLPPGCHDSTVSGAWRRGPCKAISI